MVAGCGAAPGINGAGPRARAGSATVNPYGGDPAAEGQPSPAARCMGTDREAVSFDPTVQNTNQAALAVYDSLLKFTPGEPEPYLAQSMDSADDGLTWRMGLRPGVRFSDGTPLDAHAVIINVQRHIDKASSPGNRYASQIASMRAVDPQTVEFVLKAPFGAFPSVFALNFTAGNLGAIVSPAALAQYGDRHRQPPGRRRPVRAVRLGARLEDGADPEPGLLAEGPAPAGRPGVPPAARHRDPLRLDRERRRRPGSSAATRPSCCAACRTRP